MRGRKRKPTARAIAEGDPSKRGVHKLDQRLQAEPAATKGLPFCPRHLKRAGRKMWLFWREELEAMDLDRRPDVAMLEGPAWPMHERSMLTPSFTATVWW